MSSDAVNGNGPEADTTHTPSQRYLSTRGEDSGVCFLGHYFSPAIL
jgi:hypothetical protein